MNKKLPGIGVNGCPVVILKTTFERSFNFDARIQGRKNGTR